MNYKESLNLNKLKNIVITQMKRSDGQPVKGIFIPFDDNPAIRVSDKGGIFFNLTVWENKKESSFGSHFVKTSALSKEERESMTIEEMNKFDYIIGNMKPMEGKSYSSNPYKENGESQPAKSAYTPKTPSYAPDDIPF